MSNSAYLFVHRDHPLEVRGVNSGAEMATLSLARTLARLGHKVVVAAQLRDGEQEYNGVTHWDLGSGFDVQGALERAHALGSYHLISAGRALPVILSLKEQACVSRTLITHDRAGNDFGLKPEILCRHADNVVCVSKAQRDVFVQAGADESKTVVLYNGADFEIFKVGQPEQRNYRNLVFVGALVPDKGIHLLVESFAALKTKYPDLTLDVYGTASLWGRESFFDEKKIEAQLSGIKFHGKVSQVEIAAAYVRAGLCVVPSIWFDPFPLVALEAQACGCPVLVTDQGGLKEGLLEGETGFVLREVSTAALTRALDELISDPQRLRAFSAAAIEKSRPRFTWEKVAQGFIEICERAAARSSSAVQAAPQPKPTAPADNLTAGTVGFLTTWNQECGLATYARYMLTRYQPGTFVVLAEQAALRPGAVDEQFVERCWKRESSDLNGLIAAIEKHNVRLLHLNCHYRFFSEEQLNKLYGLLRERGIKTVVQLHNPYTLDRQLGALVSGADRILVHTPENRLEVISNGAKSEKVEVLQHGVEVLPELNELQRLALRCKLGMPEDAKTIVAFGFIQAHKGMEGVLEAVLHLRNKGIKAHGYLVGSVMASDPTSAQYLSQLEALIDQHQLRSQITILNRFVSEHELSDYLQAADVVLMNYRSQYYEGSGACSLAVGAGALVAGSIAPPFASFGEAVWHITSGYPVPLAIEILVTDENVKEALRANGREYCKKHSWEKTVARIHALYAELGFRPVVMKKEKSVETQAVRNGSGKVMRVLINNRPNTYTQPGGDTVLIERTAQQLKAAGVQVTIDLEGRASPADYDLVHLFNFATPDLTRGFAERAKQSGRPFVVTTLCEDVPSFHNQSHVLAAYLVEYVRIGQKRDWWETNRPNLSQVQPSGTFNSSWIAQNAAALLVNGEAEAKIIRRSYPGCARIEQVTLGCQPNAAADPNLFIREYGVKDFILCVGRIESRKNQLMLLKALEDYDLPVVIAGGGFSYQPDYDQAVRAFKRKGKTLVVGKLSAELLASAYAAAKVHVLASWFELPGLVSLEAACQNCNVVVTDRGTAPDYFGDLAFYCEPDKEGSILNAVLAAYYAPVNSALKEKINSYTWERTAKETLAVYEQVLGFQHRVNVAEQSTTRVIEPEVLPKSEAKPNDPVQAALQKLQALRGSLGAKPSGANLTGAATPAQCGNVEELVKEGEKAAKAGNFDEANQSLARAEALSPNSVLVLRTRGLVCTAAGQEPQARSYFERALKLDPNDSRSLSGLGLNYMKEGRVADAHALFVKALGIEPDQTIAIYELIRSSYGLGRYDDLEQALRRYLAKRSGDVDMEFCLAGCLFKQGKNAEAQGLAQRILTLQPTHKGALDLIQALGSEKNSSLTAQPFAATASPSTPTPLGPTSLEQNRASLTQRVPLTDNARKLNSASNPNSSAQNDPTHRARQQIEETISRMKLGSKAPETSMDLENQLAKIEEDKHAARFEQVQRELDQFLSRPGLSAAQRERANCVMAELNALNGRVDEAEALYKKILVENSKSARALSGLGAIAGFRDQWSEAKQRFDQALEIRAEYDVPLAGLGVWALQSKDQNAAWSYFSRALRANPENMRALTGLIEIGYSLKRLSEVEQSIKAYLELHPADLNFVYSLAGCYYAQNKLEAARAEVEKIVVFKPDHKNALELMQMIDSKAVGGQASSVQAGGACA